MKVKLFGAVTVVLLGAGTTEAVSVLRMPTTMPSVVSSDSAAVIDFDSLHLCQTDAEASAEFLGGLLGGGGGGAPGAADACGDTTDAGNQNAPIVNIVNNSRMSTLFGRKAAME